MTKQILKINNLQKNFGEAGNFPVQVLDGLNLEVDEGEFVSILGSNGTGKSTLFKIISGQIKQTAGEIILEEKKLKNIPEHHISRFVSQVKQQPNDNLVLTLTLFENLYLAKIRGDLTPSVKSRNELRKEFTNILSPFGLGLENRLDDLVSLFSGGQKQTIAIIMATISNPKILLLDEHTASLDPVNSEKIIALTKKIVIEKKMTTLMITHNITHALNCGNRLLVLSKGKIKLDVQGEAKKKLNVEELLNHLHGEHIELEEDL